MENKELDKFGRPYPDPSKLVPRTAADALVIRKSKAKDGEYEILLITRKKPGPS